MAAKLGERREACDFYREAERLLRRANDQDWLSWVAGQQRLLGCARMDDGSSAM